MTKLEEAILAFRALSAEEQADLARVIVQVAADGSLDDEIDPEDLPDVLQGLAQADRGEFATDEEVEAVFRRFKS